MTQRNIIPPWLKNGNVRLGSVFLVTFRQQYRWNDECMLYYGIDLLVRKGWPAASLRGRANGVERPDMTGLPVNNSSVDPGNKPTTPLASHRRLISLEN